MQQPLFICTLPLFSTGRLLICYTGTIIQRRRIRPAGCLRLFGHVLGHAGWDHFIGNMLLFLVIAPPLEERYGGIPITLILVGALYLSQQVYDILFVQDNVANFMHIVGGACGTVFGFAVRRK